MPTTQQAPCYELNLTQSQKLKVGGSWNFFAYSPF
jgi:hypothetical protein